MVVGPVSYDPATKETIANAHQRSGGHRGLHLRYGLHLLEAAPRLGRRTADRDCARLRREGGRGDRLAAGIRAEEVREDPADRRLTRTRPAPCRTSTRAR